MPLPAVDLPAVAEPGESLLDRALAELRAPRGELPPDPRRLPFSRGLPGDPREDLLDRLGAAGPPRPDLDALLLRVVPGRSPRPDLDALSFPGAQAAVDLALDRLGRHQRDGLGWRIRSHDAGVTGLACLAFLGAGVTPATGSHRDTVRGGLRWLVRTQDPDGCFGQRETPKFTYDHACATLAMVEAYARTGSPHLRTSAQRGVDFVLRCQSSGSGWGYWIGPGDLNTSVTTWMVLALHAARRAGLRVPAEPFEGARAWIERVTEPEYGKAGYSGQGTGPARPMDIMDRFPPDRSEACTAMGLCVRLCLGEKPEASDMIQKGMELCLKLLPEWDEDAGSIDLVYWLYGTMAMCQAGGEMWKAWRSAMKTAILDHQRKDGDETGSWDPVDPWGRVGGRVYSTAILAMCLEAAGGDARLFGPR